MLRRAHRDHLAHRVDAEEVVADLPHLAQVVFDVVLAQLRDVEPEVLAEARARALAFLMCSSMRRDTTSREASSFFSGS